MNKSDNNKCNRCERSENNCVCYMPWHPDSPDYEGEDWDKNF